MLRACFVSLLSDDRCCYSPVRKRLTRFPDIRNMDSSNQIVRRQYAAHKGDDLISQVFRVVVVISPNSFITAGYHPSGEVLAINSSQLQGADWNAAFIEHELQNEPLLADPALIKCIFVATQNNMVIPGALYQDEQTAKSWLQSSFHIPAQEAVSVCELGKGQWYNCFSFPESIAAVFKKYTEEPRILPLNIVQLRNGQSTENLLQCTVTDTCAVATLHHKHHLHWHQTFAYQTAEDIAHRLGSACRYYGIELDEYPVAISTISIEQHAVLTKLQQYFPALATRKAIISDVTAPEWSAAVHLFQQLFTCA